MSSAAVQNHPHPNPLPEYRERGTAHFPLAYIAGTLPLRSETFVWREIRALRARGWAIQSVSLHESKDATPPELLDLESGRIVVYGSGTRDSIKSYIKEVFRHPVRSWLTMMTATFDGIFSGEPMTWRERIKLPFQAKFAIGLAARLRSAGIRHIHCHFAHAPTTIGMYAAQHVGVPFSFTGHANDLFQRRAILKPKLRRAAFVSCISQWHRELYESIEPSVGPRAKVIRCGVDVVGWNKESERTDAGPARILTVCRLVEKKGIDILIRAVADLTRRGRDVRLTIAGDGEDRARLESIASESAVADRINWLGAVANDRVPALLAEADVFALPCRPDACGDKDGIPVVLMEAMACGVPCVSGDLPAIRELIQHDVSGMLVDGNDATALANQLDVLLSDPKRRQTLAAAGRQRVVEEFSLETNINRLEQMLIASADKLKQHE
jgi:glycosyltransferase involved in cell wall biosynthesis